MTVDLPIFDPVQLEELRAIGVMTPTFFGTLSESFAQVASGSTVKIEQACEAGDHEALYRAAHALKGCAATFGAVRLAARAGELEVLGRFKSALPPVEAMADLVDLAHAASGHARDWATRVGVTAAHG